MSEKLLLTTDLDEPLKPFRPGFTDWINQKHGTNFDHENINQYNLVEFFGFASREELEAEVDAYHEYEALDPSLTFNENAIEVMGILSDRFDFAIITARKCKFKSYTLSQMELAGIRVAAYHREDYESHGMSKGDLAKDLGSAAFVDDYPGHVDSAIKVGVTSYIFDDTLNQNYKGEAVRVRNWYEIHDELEFIYRSLVKAV